MLGRERHSSGRPSSWKRIVLIRIYQCIDHPEKGDRVPYRPNKSSSSHIIYIYPCISCIVLGPHKILWSIARHTCLFLYPVDTHSCISSISQTFRTSHICLQSTCHTPYSRNTYPNCTPRTHLPSKLQILRIPSIPLWIDIFCILVCISCRRIHWSSRCPGIYSGTALHSANTLANTTYSFQGTDRRSTGVGT